MTELHKTKAAVWDAAGQLCQHIQVAASPVALNENETLLSVFKSEFERSRSDSKKSYKQIDNFKQQPNNDPC